MTSERRNPYLILGIPYGATKAEAARAFAKTTRRLRNDPDAPFQLEDLNWALHQVEQVHEDLDSAVAIFRVPANPDIYRSDGYGLLSPEPVPMRRCTPPVEEGLREQVAAVAGTELLRHLLQVHGSTALPEAPFSIVREEGD